MNIMVNKFFIALVGTNPLPVYISALKVCDNETKAILIHTKGKTLYDEKVIGTKEVAKNIGDELHKKISGMDIKLVECDKSDPKRIREVLDNIKENELKNLQSDIYIDYTSGTKMMSSTIYMYFKNLEKQNIYKDIYFSYVDNTTSKLLIEKKDSFGLNKIFEENDVTIENIINLHGYKFKEKYEEKELKDMGIKYIDVDTSFTNGIREISGYKVFCKDFKVCLFKDSVESEKRRCKMELFIMKDDSEKLGGSEAKMMYKCKCEKEDKEKITDEVVNLCSIDMKHRLKVINEQDDLEKSII